MSWNRGWSTSSWGSSSWDKNNRRVGTTVTGNRQPIKHLQHRHLRNRGGAEWNCFNPVVSFTPDWECYDSNSVSNKKFYRNIQSTPWSTKSGLAGKDIADLRVTELTRKGLDDFSLRCLSNGEFQSIVFVRSVSEAVFVSNLLRHIRQDRIDLDAVAAHMHGPAPPDKRKESARFMQPLLGEVVSTIKSHAPAPAASSSQSPESAELAKPRAAQNSPSSTGPSLPTKGMKFAAEEILEKGLITQPPPVPGSTSNEAVEKWLKKHQGQFRGKANAFKKHVADICSVFQAS